jgi:hypothetical protein
MLSFSIVLHGASLNRLPHRLSTCLGRPVPLHHLVTPYIFMSYQLMHTSSGAQVTAHSYCLLLAAVSLSNHFPDAPPSLCQLSEVSHSSVLSSVRVWGYRRVTKYDLSRRCLVSKGFCIETSHVQVAYRILWLRVKILHFEMVTYHVFEVSFL